MTLADTQYQLLKQLSKGDIDKNVLTKDELEDVSFLGDCGFVCYHSVMDDSVFPKREIIFIHLKPKGKAEYDAYSRERRRWRIPLGVSIVSLIISFLTLIATR